jgi:hypothetical protein
MPQSPPPRGFGPPGVINLSWSFESWAAEPEVRAAWAELKAKHSLEAPRDLLDNAQDVLCIVDADVLGPWARSPRYVLWLRWC